MSTVAVPGIGASSTPEQHARALPIPPLPTHDRRGSLLPAVPWLRGDRWRGAALVVIKATHSLVFFAEEASVGYLLYAGLTKRQNRTAAIAAAAVALESAIYFGNGRRCPLTGVAEELGAEHGSVTDIYLPRWIAARIFTYNAPLVVVAALLHARIFLARRLARKTA